MRIDSQPNHAKSSVDSMTANYSVSSIWLVRPSYVKRAFPWNNTAASWEVHRFSTVCVRNTMWNQKPLRNGRRKLLFYSNRVETSVFILRRLFILIRDWAHKSRTETSWTQQWNSLRVHSCFLLLDWPWASTPTDFLQPTLDQGALTSKAMEAGTKLLILRPMVPSWSIQILHFISAPTAGFRMKLSAWNQQVHS